MSHRARRRPNLVPVNAFVIIRDGVVTQANLFQTHPPLGDRLARLLGTRTAAAH